MFAIDLQNGRGQLKTTSLNGSTLTVSDFYYVEEKNASTTNVTRTPIALEPCTSQHFSTAPDANEKFNIWGLSSFSCLPLGQTYEIRGS